LHGDGTLHGPGDTARTWGHEPSDARCQTPSGKGILECAAIAHGCVSHRPGPEGSCPYLESQRFMSLSGVPIWMSLSGCDLVGGENEPSPRRDADLVISRKPRIVKVSFVAIGEIILSGRRRDGHLDSNLNILRTLTGCRAVKT
jgi:hypothetical protein